MNEAISLLRGFHRRLCETRVLDPACGSGNFLYVTLDVFKRLEGEVLAALSALGETQELLAADAIRVTPAQFLGIEVKRWAKEIAELVLWIGYLQWHFRAYGKSMPVPSGLQLAGRGATRALPTRPSGVSSRQAGSRSLRSPRRPVRRRHKRRLSSPESFARSYASSS
jgi:hypothetical protein